MKIKASKDGITGIVLLLGVLMQQNPPEDKAEKLVFSIVNKVYNKIRMKSESLIAPRGGWGFTMSDQESLALFIFISNVHVSELLYPYETNQIRQVCGIIDQTYG